MNEAATRGTTTPDRVSAEAEQESLELNGAIVLRTRRRPAPVEAAPGPAATNGHGHGDDNAGGAGRRGAAGAPGDLRARLVKLQRATGSELERRGRLEDEEVEPPDVAELSSILREIPRLALHAPAAAGAVAGALRPGEMAAMVGGALHMLRVQAGLRRSDRRGPNAVDDFGFDEEWTDTLRPFFAWLYRRYWRVRTIGVENVPRRGRALLVSNHAGVLPYDGAMIRTAILEEHSVPRHARALIFNAAFSVPLSSWFLRRTGNTLAHPDDARRLLERGELVLVFPEGVKGTGKPYRDRYRLRRFGRGGFVQTALRTGAPIIPVSVVGSEELHPMLGNLAPLARMVGMPYWPVTATFPWLGPLGMLPLPSSWIIEFHEPVPTAGHGPDAARDPALVMTLAERVRDTIQQGLYRNLELRGSVFGSVG